MPEYISCVIIKAHKKCMIIKAYATSNQGTLCRREEAPSHAGDEPSRGIKTQIRKVFDEFISQELLFPYWKFGNK